MMRSSLFLLVVCIHILAVEVPGRQISIPGGKSFEDVVTVSEKNGVEYEETRVQYSHPRVSGNVCLVLRNEIHNDVQSDPLNTSNQKIVTLSSRTVITLYNLQGEMQWEKDFPAPDVSHLTDEDIESVEIPNENVLIRMMYPAAQEFSFIAVYNIYGDEMISLSFEEYNIGKLYKPHISRNGRYFAARFMGPGGFFLLLIDIIQGEVKISPKDVLVNTVSDLGEVSFYDPRAQRNSSLNINTLHGGE